jgi:hypothetical protein
VRKISALAIAGLAAAVLAACTAGSSPQPSISSPQPSARPSAPSAQPSASAAALVLREAPANLGCDTMGWQGEPYTSLTFRIDPAAAEQVSAVSNTGAELQTFWAAGFVGSATERVIRDPAGQVVARDGEVLAVPAAAFPRLHGYFVCLNPDKLYVLLADPE